MDPSRASADIPMAESATAYSSADQMSAGARPQMSPEEYAAAYQLYCSQYAQHATDMAQQNHSASGDSSAAAAVGGTAENPAGGQPGYDASTYAYYAQQYGAYYAQLYSQGLTSTPAAQASSGSPPHPSTVGIGTTSFPPSAALAPTAVGSIHAGTAHIAPFRTIQPGNNPNIPLAIPSMMGSINDPSGVRLDNNLPTSEAEIMRCHLHTKPQLNCKYCRKYKGAVHAISHVFKQSAGKDGGAMGEERKVIEMTNKTHFNVNALLRDNIINSDYYKSLHALKECDEIVDEIYQYCDHAEPYCAGAARAPSTLFCCLYKLFIMGLSERQVRRLMDHPDSPYIRAAGFLFIRYVLPPDKLWGWCGPYLLDDEMFQASSVPTVTTKEGGSERGGGSQVGPPKRLLHLGHQGKPTSYGDPPPGQHHQGPIEFGVFVQNLLSDDKYFNTILPRLPLKIKNSFGPDLLAMENHRKRKKSNREILHKFTPGTQVVACSNGDWLEGELVSIEHDSPGLVTCVVTLEDGSTERLDLGLVKLAVGKHRFHEDEADEVVEGSQIGDGGEDRATSHESPRRGNGETSRDRSSYPNDRNASSRERGRGGGDRGKEKKDYGGRGSSRRSSSPRSRSPSTTRHSSHRSKTHQHGSRDREDRRHSRNSSRYLDDRNSHGESASRSRSRSRMSRQDGERNHAGNWKDRERSDKGYGGRHKTSKVRNETGDEISAADLAEVYKQQQREKAAASGKDYARRPASYKSALSYRDSYPGSRPTPAASSSGQTDRQARDYSSKRKHREDSRDNYLKRRGDRSRSGSINREKGRRTDERKETQSERGSSSEKRRARHDSD